MDDAQRDDIWFCHQPTLPTFLIRVVSSTVALVPAYGQLVFLVQAQVQIASGGPLLPFPTDHSPSPLFNNIPEYRIDSQTKEVPARSSLDVASAFRFPPGGALNDLPSGSSLRRRRHPDMYTPNGLG